MPKRSSGIFVLIVVSCENESFLFPFCIPISLTKEKESSNSHRGLLGTIHLWESVIAVYLRQPLTASPFWISQRAIEQKVQLW